jgi:alkylhydroperoxidase/carboxymuconolactone decarboxylase family protein YurZ
MNRHPMDIVRENDPELFQAFSDAGSLALMDGALPAKYKLLTAMALDAVTGAANGVKSLAMQAITAGATKAEIFETLRVAYHISGAGSVYTAAQGLNDLFAGSQAL